MTASEAIPWSSGWRREAAEAGAHGRRRRGEEAARGVGEAERSVGNEDGREMIENDIE